MENGEQRMGLETTGDKAARATQELLLLGGKRMDRGVYFRVG